MKFTVLLMVLLAGLLPAGCSAPAVQSSKPPSKLWGQVQFLSDPRGDLVSIVNSGTDTWYDFRISFTFNSDTFTCGAIESSAAKHNEIGYPPGPVIVLPAAYWVDSQDRPLSRVMMVHVGGVDSISAQARRSSMSDYEDIFMTVLK